MAVLERGGNAFDAAVAAGLTLQVVEPHLNGPGGDLPAVFWPASRGEPVVLCAQGVAPASATIERVRGMGHDLIPGTGPLAACVPGAFGGWLLLLQEFGTWRLEDVLAFAIGYAEHGYPVVAGITMTIERSEPLLREWPASAALYLPAPQPGTTFRNPQLAATWTRLLDEARGGSREEEIERARRVFYEGFVAEEIDGFSRENGGLLDADDMREWRATLEPPVTFDYRGLTVCKTGPWGQGPVGLQQLALLSGFDIGDASDEELVHVVTECAKLAFADRDAAYGDALPVRSTRCSRRSTTTSGAGSSQTRRRASCAPGSAGCRRFIRQLTLCHSASVSRRAATRFISTSPIASATCSPRRRPAAGSTARRSFLRSAGRSERARRCSGSKKVSLRR